MLVRVEEVKAALTRLTDEEILESGVLDFLQISIFLFTPRKITFDAHLYYNYCLSRIKNKLETGWNMLTENEEPEVKVILVWS